MEAIDQADQITDLLRRSLDMDHKAARGADAIHISRRAGHRRVPDGEVAALRLFKVCLASSFLGGSLKMLDSS